MGDTYDLDLFTLGAGSGGVRASRMAASRGARVAVAEARFLGGTCVNVGCVPKKLMVYASQYGGAFAESVGFGWSPGEASFDMRTLIANKDREIARLNTIYESLLSGSGCEILEGHARIVAPHTVEVTAADGSVVRRTAEHILVATGGHPVRPTEPGTEHAWVSDDIFTLEHLPQRVLVVGGGYIGLEMAGILRGLGSEVHLAVRGPHVLRGFDEDVRTFLTEELRKKGIHVHCSTLVRALETRDDGTMLAVLDHRDALEVDAALYAIGRLPNTADLGLASVGVETNARGAIVVDAHFRTSVPGIYALGDVTDRINLTPVATTEAMALVETLFGDGPRAVDYTHIPTAVFSQPPLACVGLTEAQARELHGPVHVYSSEFRAMKHTLSGSDERTFMKLIVHPDTDLVLGVHVVGEDAPEIIQGFAVALKCGATKAQFDATIGLHPTSAEELVTMRNRRPEPAPRP